MTWHADVPEDMVALADILRTDTKNNLVDSDY
jgi:23S rRNA pseudouridine1911/1915/1917 synthase